MTTFSNLKDYLLIKEAAELMGVSQGTLRNWGHAGKIATYRHPLNKYRLYKKSDLEAVLQQIHRSVKRTTGKVRKSRS
jgi:excisionase family DNA binding protein